MAMRPYYINGMPILDGKKDDPRGTPNPWGR